MRYGARSAVIRSNDLTHLLRLGFSAEVASASISWLHQYLRDLSRSGFVAPAPIDDLGGRSTAVVEGAIWELLTFVPGVPMGWLDNEIRAAGGMLARFHDASLRTPRRLQRPGALPVGLCRPTDPSARAVTQLVEGELARVSQDRLPRGVVHGDATQANVIIDGDELRLVDFALAYEEVLLFDIASALWRNGRVDANAVSYDGRRVGLFVRGYHSVRPLAPSDGHSIVTYMMGRGLQLQQRLERRGGTDATVMQRLLSIDRQQTELREAIEAALS